MIYQICYTAHLADRISGTQDASAKGYARNTCTEKVRNVVVANAANSYQRQVYSSVVHLLKQTFVSVEPENGSKILLCSSETERAAADIVGTLSGKTLNDKIAAAVAVKSEPRLVWNTTVTAAASNHNMIRSYDIQIPDGVDYVHIKSKSERGDGTEVDIARGGSTYHNLDASAVATYSTTTFRSEGTLHFQFEKSTNASITFWVTGYHYPTLADLLTQVTAVESSVTDLQVALCELYEEKEGN